MLIGWTHMKCETMVTRYGGESILHHRVDRYDENAFAYTQRSERRKKEQIPSNQLLFLSHRNSALTITLRWAFGDTETTHFTLGRHEQRTNKYPYIATTIELNS